MTRAGAIAVALGLTAAAACSTLGPLDPAVPMRLPRGDVALGATGAVIWDEREPLDQGDPLVGVDASWLDGVWGLHAGVRWHGEGARARVGALIEATGWYGALFGIGARIGWATSGAVGPVVDLTLSLGLPIPLVRDCAERRWSIVLVPFVRPGFRLSGGDRDPDDVRGVHELGVSLRWSTFSF